jgi:hypothetical protein
MLVLEEGMFGERRYLPESLRATDPDRTVL